MTEEQRKAKTFLDRYKRASTESEAAELYEEIESAIDAAKIGRASCRERV